jgi:hypothetical protein
MAHGILLGGSQSAPFLDAVCRPLTPCADNFVLGREFPATILSPRLLSFQRQHKLSRQSLSSRRSHLCSVSLLCSRDVPFGERLAGGDGSEGDVFGNEPPRFAPPIGTPPKQSRSNLECRQAPYQRAQIPQDLLSRRRETDHTGGRSVSCSLLNQQRFRLEGLEVDHYPSRPVRRPENVSRQALH